MINIEFIIVHRLNEGHIYLYEVIFHSASKSPSHNYGYCLFSAK